MVLWNPATGKHKHIQSPPDSGIPCFYGFWYDDSCNEFRILSIRDKNQVLVFDSNSDSWKTANTLRRNLYVGQDQLDSKAFIHGGFHVAAYDRDEKRYRILSLSPQGKVIRDFRPPSDSDDNLILTAKVWEGRLCLQALAWIWTSGNCYCFEYWIMEEYGKSESWKRVESLRYPQDYFLVSLQQNGRQLWLKYMDGMNGDIFVKDGDDNDEMESIISSSSKSMLFVGTYTYTPTLLSP